MKTYTVERGHFEHVAVFAFDAEELRGIASALGHEDVGAQEMLRAAAEVEAADLDWWGE